MWSDGISRPILRSERSIQVKIARKIHAEHRQQKKLDGLYEVLAPRSTVGKVSPTTTAIEDPNRPEVRVRNSDISNFETRHKRDTELGQYIEKRPKKGQEKALEQKIINQKRDLLRKDLGNKKIKSTRK